MKKIIMLALSLVLVAAIAVPTTLPIVNANSGIPTISIVSVVTDQKVTIRTDDFPANVNFTVTMGAYGTLGIGGTVVATTNSGSGGAFEVTYTVPSGLKGAKQIAIRLQATSGGFFAYNWFWNNTGTATTTTPPGYTGIPTFSIVSVDADKNVTIQTSNFPANIDFKVLMGPFGTLGIGGTSVTTINSGSGSSFTKTFDIPSGLKGSERIAIRLEGTTGGFLAFNWFWNNTATTTTTTPPGYTGIPTFSIVSVDADKNVKIQTNNFPANIDFKVLMGPFGTLGIGGTSVTTITSGSGGSFTKTFDIPSGLKGSTRIAIRLEGTTGGFLAFNWFWNNTATTTTTTTTTTGFTGIPTFSILSVNKDASVTIQANNFPANIDFNVLMGPYGILGVGGTAVTTINSGSGGSFTKTFSIPSGLKGSTRIAIRMENTTGGFFAFNWFWNN